MNQIQLPLDFDLTLPEDFTNLVIYRSSAGSGKTFSLVKDYIKLLLRDTENYRKILAITFTNKATEEMKVRILRELSEMALEIKTDMYMLIEEEFGREFSKTGSHVPPIPKRAREALSKILHNYGKFGISTLDHFFTRVVRAMAKELDLPLKYDIDVDNDRAIDYAITETYNAITEDPELRSWLEEFAFSKIEDNKTWNPDLELKNLGKELFNERFHEGIGKKTVSLDEFKRFMMTLASKRDMFSKKMRGLGEAGLAMINQYELKVEDFLRKGAGNVGDFRKMIRGEFSLGKTFIKIAKGEADWFAQSSPKRRKIEEAAEGGLNDLAREVYHYYLAEYPSYLSSMMLMKNIFAYGILDFLDERLKDYRSENNILLLDDNTFLMNEFIVDQDAPFIYEKIGTRYQHILIDEFQDTSLYQWKNLLPLIRNSLYENGQVLIVGDEKQSIYRWRGGEMRLLVSGVEQDLKHFKSQTRVEDLKNNYRSSRTIVGFNNAFFKSATDLLCQNINLPQGETLLADTYKNINQTNKKDALGYVELQFFKNDPQELHEEKERTWKEKAKDETVKVILRARSQGFSFGDILILIDRWVMGDEIAQHLVAHDLPIISDRTLQVQNSPKIKLLLSALKWLHNTEDRLAKTNLLFLYIQSSGIDDYDYDVIFRDIHNDGRIFTEVMPREFLGNLRVFLRLPLYEMVENLIIVFGLNNATDNFILRFLEICLEQSTWGRNDLHSFLDWWEIQKENLTVIMPETDNAIRIMTIHGAKGLEKPIVILPFANFDLHTKNNSTFWTDRLADNYKPFKLLPLNFSSKLLETDFVDAYKHELQEGMVERLNSVYVAFTRAVTRLYVFVDFQNRLAQPSEIGSLSSLLKAVLAQGPLYPKEWKEVNDRRVPLEAEDIYCWGSENKKESISKKESEEVGELSSIISSPVGDKVRIRADSNRFFMLFDNEVSRKIKQGIILHRMLELMDDPSDPEPALNALVAEGHITLGEIPDARKSAASFFNNDQVRKWFDGSWEVVNERDIFSEGKTYRPDRVLLGKEETLVIDYKTGVKENRHRKQVQNYSELLKKIGYKNIKGYLVYLTLDEIDRVK